MEEKLSSTPGGEEVDKEVYEQFETSEVDKSINLRKNKSNKFFYFKIN